MWRLCYRNKGKLDGVAITSGCNQWIRSHGRLGLGTRALKHRAVSKTCGFENGFRTAWTARELLRWRFGSFARDQRYPRQVRSTADRYSRDRAHHAAVDAERRPHGGGGLLRANEHHHVGDLLDA